MIAELIKNLQSLNGKQKTFYSGIATILVLFSLYVYLHRPPDKFPLNEVITIDEGESLQNITNTLYNANIIRYPFLFRNTVILLGGERKVIAGDYLLDKKVGPVDIAYRLVKGDFHTEAQKVTIPEGWDIFEIAKYLEKNLENFKSADFLKLAKNKEGYLFPDTYFIHTTMRPKSIVKLMTDTFESKIKNISALSTTTRSLDEVITMASILEGEANTTVSRRTVAGILWKRIAVGMPLQVDATFSYINGKGSSELTLNDLQIDSPYNTYKYKGLPPTPISNPGIDAIESALNPIETKYLYFLTGKDGKMYYGRTFEEHKRNRRLYLD